jgi:hypothetical protein
MTGNSSSLLLGRTLDGIPFSTYHLQLILVLGAVGFVEGYDLALGGSLLVLAKEPLHLTRRPAYRLDGRVRHVLATSRQATCTVADC